MKPTFTQDNDTVKSFTEPTEPLTTEQKEAAELKRLLLKFNGTAVLTEAKAVVSEVNTAEIERLQARNVTLRAEIDSRNEELKRNILRMKSLGDVDSNGGTRIRTECTECGQKSHMPNAKTAACSIFQAKQNH